MEEGPGAKECKDAALDVKMAKSAILTEVSG